MSTDLGERLNRRFMDTVSNIAVNATLPHQVHVLIKDAESGKTYGGFCGVEYTDVKGVVKLTRTTIGEVREGITPLNIANHLMKVNPGIPLVCDETIMDELAGASLISDGHYRLLIGEAETLEVYIPLKSKPILKDSLSHGTSGGQIFLE